MNVRLMVDLGAEVLRLWRMNHDCAWSVKGGIVVAGKTGAYAKVPVGRYVGKSTLRLARRKIC